MQSRLASSLGCRGTPCFARYAGACTYHPADGSQTRDDKRRVRQLADAHRGIDMLLNEVDGPVSEQQADVDVGIGLQELRHQRDDMKAPEHDRRRDRQLALRPGELAARRALGLTEFLDEPAARLEELPAALRERDLAGRANEETRLQMLLELRQRAG